MKHIFLSRYIEIFEARKSALDREIRNGATNEFGFNETRRDRGGPSFGRGGGGGGFRDRSPVRRDRSPIRKAMEINFAFFFGGGGGGGGGD